MANGAEKSYNEKLMTKLEFLITLQMKHYCNNLVTLKKKKKNCGWHEGQMNANRHLVREKVASNIIHAITVYDLKITFLVKATGREQFQGIIIQVGHE